MRYLILVILFVNVATGCTQNQQQTITQYQYWFRYYGRLSLSEKFSLHAEADERRFFNPDRQSQFFTHLHLHYKPYRTLEVAQGFSYIASVSARNDQLTIPEFRAFQEITWFIPSSSKSKYSLRYRLDDRFIRHADTSELMAGYSFNLRHRFKAQWQILLSSSEKPHQSTLKVANEIMVNSGNVDYHFDQNRIYAAVERALSKHWSVEAGYLNIYQNRGNPGYYLRHVVRITLYHHLTLRKEPGIQ